LREVGPGETASTVFEAFKPGQAPSSYDSVAGNDVIDETQPGISPNADRAVMRSGTGGLY
jgi:penicillin-binding protein 1A